MYAFALYDVRRSRLLVVRDRFGIKPLFFAPGPGRLAFASEINALRAVPGVDWSPDRQAVSDYAALGFVPSPASFYTGVRSLEPAHVLEASWASGAVRWTTRQYHRWRVAPDPGLTREAARNRARDLIGEAVESQLESDVPLGTLLSGGIDSSLVSAAAQRARSGGISSFSVRFADREFDETSAALSVAERIGSRHAVIDVPPGGGRWEAVVALLRHAGQPFADTSLFAVQAICREMRKHVTVALSGDGGDEAFGGYDLFRHLSSIDRLRRLSPGLGFAARASLRPLASMGLVRRTLPRRAKELAGADDTTVVESLYSWLRPADHAQLCRIRGVHPVRRLFEGRWDNIVDGDGLEALSARATEVGIRLVLPDDYLFKVDTASMHESLEVRVPLLDERLVAFGLTLPHRLKVVGRKGKRVLRDVAEEWLPADVIERPKHGFGMPVRSWVDAEFKDALRERLLSPSSRLPDYFVPEIYAPWVEAFCGERNGVTLSQHALTQRVVMLLSADLALRPEAA